MSWKYVFNSSLKPSLWGHIGFVIKCAQEAGYDFFTWNGLIYSIDGKVTKFRIEDLK